MYKKFYQKDYMKIIFQKIVGIDYTLHKLRNVHHKLVSCSVCMICEFLFSIYELLQDKCSRSQQLCFDHLHHIWLVLK